MRLLRAYLPALLWSLVVATLAGATDLPGTPRVPYFDKLAHFGVYAVLGVLLGWGWLRAGLRPEFGDWLADALGAATGLYIATRLGRRLLTSDDTDDE
jgi:hypothetical protein